MDSTWPFNFDCTGIPQNTPAYYDTLIIPTLFYKAVLTRNTQLLINLIKYNPQLSVAVVIFYDNILRGAFYTKKDAKYGMPFKIKWNTLKNNNKIILNFNEQSELYSYITTPPKWNFTNMGFLINTINDYLVQLRFVMGLINNRIPANQYYNLGVNVTNNIQMKYFIAKFIPGYRY
jgi:hypothetical protein